MDSHEDWTFICGSRRDQEEGGGAGPSREPRKDQEQGGGAGPESWTAFYFSCSSTAVLRASSLCFYSEQQLKQQLAENTSCFALAMSPLP